MGALAVELVATITISRYPRTQNPSLSPPSPPPRPSRTTHIAGGSRKPRPGSRLGTRAEDALGGAVELGADERRAHANPVAHLAEPRHLEGGSLAELADPRSAFLERGGSPSRRPAACARSRRMRHRRRGRPISADESADEHRSAARRSLHGGIGAGAVLLLGHA